MATATAMATAMAMATATVTDKTLRLQIKLWLMLWNCQPSSPFVCLPSASASCRITAHCPLMPPILVVPHSPLPVLIVLILSPCHHRPYARCNLLHCHNCICDFHLLLMPFAAALSLICWRVHAATSCCTPLLSGWLLCHSALIIIVVSSSNGAPVPRPPNIHPYRLLTCPIAWP
jgi:hypothetical protein